MVESQALGLLPLTASYRQCTTHRKQPTQLDLHPIALVCLKCSADNGQARRAPRADCGSGRTRTALGLDNRTEMGVGWSTAPVLRLGNITSEPRDSRCHLKPWFSIAARYQCRQSLSTTILTSEQAPSEQREHRFQLRPSSWSGDVCPHADGDRY